MSQNENTSDHGVKDANGVVVRDTEENHLPQDHYSPSAATQKSSSIINGNNNHAAAADNPPPIFTISNHNDVPEATSGTTLNRSGVELNGQKDQAPQKEEMKTKIRNWTGFWLLGLCNNYGYVIMLSAAFDILRQDFHDGGDSKNGTSAGNTSEPLCNPMSTGAVLLADIIPSLTTKMLSPFIFTNTQLRVIAVIGLSASSFILVAESVSVGMSFFGIICASISSGLGEVTFLSFSAGFDKRVVSGWSSGTGMAGLAGAGVYTLLTSVIQLSPRTTLNLMIVVPIIMAFTFWLLIRHPEKNILEAVATRRLLESSVPSNRLDLETTDSSVASLVSTELSFRQKLTLAKPLALNFMVPLGLVYFFEYYINQGFFELMFFKNNTLRHAVQYRWYQTLYQLGVFISRSSVELFQIRNLWIMPFLQGINFVLFLMHILFPFLGSIYVAMAIIVYEGLLGGAAYVNTFYRISQESLPQHKSFNMGFTSMADSFGITIAGLLAIPTHNLLCDYLNQKA